MNQHSKRYAIAGTVVVALALTGCSSASKPASAPGPVSPAVTSSTASQAPASTSSAASVKASPVAVLTSAQIAAKAGCADIQPADKSGATDSVFCTLGAVAVEVATFPNNTARDAYVQAGKTIAAPSGIRVGDRWVAMADRGTGSADDLAPFGGLAA